MLAARLKQSSKQLTEKNVRELFTETDSTNREVSLSSLQNLDVFALQVVAPGK